MLFTIILRFPIDNKLFFLPYAFGACRRLRRFRIVPPCLLDHAEQRVA